MPRPAAMSPRSLRARPAGGSRPRYQEPWFDAFNARLASALRPGVSILDVGAGRRPCIPRESRPARCHYVGLDVSAEELEIAPSGSYDEYVIGDVTQSRPELCNRFDLAVSWQVLEHVSHLDSAVDNIHAYLRPGGWLVAQVSGRFSVYALANLVLPHRLVASSQERIFGRDPDTVFPAHYDKCSCSGLRQALVGWGSAEILPRYRAAGYFDFSGLLQRVYLVYEDWIVKRGYEGLATHYLVFAVR